MREGGDGPASFSRAASCVPMVSVSGPALLIHAGVFAGAAEPIPIDGFGVRTAPDDE
jgi:hypothetical protein